MSFRPEAGMTAGQIRPASRHPDNHAPLAGTGESRRSAAGMASSNAGLSEEEVAEVERITLERSHFM